MLNRLEDCVQRYQQALSLNSESPECHFNLASACNDLGQRNEAIKHYQFAIGLDNDNVDAHLCLGAVFQEAQDYDKASQAFENVLKIDP